MLNEAMSHAGGNVDRGIVPIEQRCGGDDADLVLGDVRRDNDVGHGAKILEGRVIGGW